MGISLLFACPMPDIKEILPSAYIVHPVVAVRQVVHGSSMSEPDTINEGWSVAGLWCLWLSFVAVSLVISIVLARMPWIPRLQLEIDYEHTHDNA